ncbi:MAG: hypothetical protein JXQ23_07915 [Clostridia bacterium]|nr:hypothetical protein [Clostridia bacterium]
MSKMKKNHIIILIILLSLLLTSCELYLPEKEIIYKMALNQNDEYLISTNEVVIGDLAVEKIKYGEFVPDEEKVSYAEGTINSKITDIYVRIGDHVTKGQLIAKTESDQISDTIFFQEIYTKQAVLRYEDAKKKFDQNLIDYYQLELLRLISISKQNYLSDLYAQFEACFIYAPTDGEVVEIIRTVGDIGIGEIAKICDKRDGVIRISTEKEADEFAVNAGYAAPIIVSPDDYLFNRMKNGTAFTIETNEQQYEGYLYRDIGTYMLLYGEEQTLNYIDIRMKKIPDDIFFGQSMTVIYTQAHVEDAMVVSASSVYTDVDDKHYVYLVKNNRTIIREIQTGLMTDGFVQVIDGLEVGEKVLLLR